MLVKIAKSVGLPITSEGILTDYFINGKWRHIADVNFAPGKQQFVSNEEVLDVLTNDEHHKNFGITRSNISHFVRFFGYDGDPNELREHAQDVEYMKNLFETYQFSIVIVNKELYQKFMMEE